MQNTWPMNEEELEFESDSDSTTTLCVYNVI